MEALVNGDRNNKKQQKLDLTLKVREALRTSLICLKLSH